MRTPPPPDIPPTRPTPPLAPQESKIAGTLYVWPDGKMVLDVTDGDGTARELNDLRELLEATRAQWLTGEIALVVGPGITVQLVDPERPIALPAEPLASIDG